MKNITLSEFERDETQKSLYCINTTKGRSRGQVIFSVPRAGTMGMESVIIPPTFIPIELTAQANRDQLLASTDLRKAIAKGLIELVSSVDAISFMGTDPHAKIEFNRLANAQEYQRNVMTATHMDDVPEHNIVDPAMQEFAAPIHYDMENAVDSVTGSIVHLIGMLQESKDDTDAIASVRAMGELTTQDLKYIYEKAPKECKNLVNWAREKYNRSRLNTK